MLYRTITKTQVRLWVDKVTDTFSLVYVLIHWYIKSPKSKEATLTNS